MVVTLWLLGWALAPAQPTVPPLPTTPTGVVPAAPTTPRGHSDAWLIPPRLMRAQELIYRGTYTEQDSGPRVQYRRSYHLDLRCFVVDAPPKGAEIALLTVLRSNEPRLDGRKDGPARSVRMERLHVDLQGKVTADPGVSLTVPLEGAPTLESGFLMDIPPKHTRVGQSWTEEVSGQPSRQWTVNGPDTANTVPCLAVTGVQQSDDWDQPRADRTAWRRTDRVWLSTQTGIAARVERIIEQREPARREPTSRSILRYESEPSLSYPGRLAEGPRQEISQWAQFRTAATPLLASPARFEKQLTTLASKIDLHLETQPPTPYRPALLALRAQIEAARRGEAVAVEPEIQITSASTPANTTPRAPAVITLGHPAPDFIATDLTAPSTSAKLARWKGKPLLMVFYHPDSARAADVLTFCQNLHVNYGRYLSVVALSVEDDSKKVLPQRTALKCTFPVLAGAGLRVSYAVESTPKLVLIDGAGIVRGDYLGWGHETPTEVMSELRNWLPH
jgi:hypothetical protein